MSESKPKSAGRASKVVKNKPLSAETKKVMLADILQTTAGRPTWHSKEGRAARRADEAAEAAKAKPKQVRNTSGLRPPWKKGESGNPKGQPGNMFHRINRLTSTERKEMADKYGVTPLEFLLSVMADDDDPMEDRQAAAKAAMPYVHRRMPIRVEMSAPPDEAAAMVRSALAEIDVVTSGGKLAPVIEKPVRKAFKKAAK